MINYINNRENENLFPIELDNKEKYYDDLVNLEQNFTGRVDLMFLNQFLLEAAQMIVNAMVLFEKGYFDAAYYSLRQSLEISTTSMYLADGFEESRKQEFSKWKNQEWFPMNNKMLKKLEERGNVFAEVKEKMKSYFEEIEEIKNKLNKYVHKQGFDKFYVSRARILKEVEKEKELKRIASDFEEFLVKSIGAVAVFRLVIDPIPVLLMDGNIFNRTRELLAEGYTYSFIKEYIGINHIEDYKKTEVYKSHYDFFMKEEEMLPAVMNVVKDQFIDRAMANEITSQIHLLSPYDIIAVSLALFAPKVTHIYIMDGWLWYFTDIKSKRKKISWSSEELKIFSRGIAKYNAQYDEAFLSQISVAGEDYQIEHNEEFNLIEIEELNKMIILLSKDND